MHVRFPLMQRIATNNLLKVHIEIIGSGCNVRRSQSSFVINGCLLNIGLGLACYFLYLEFLVFVLASWKTVLQSNVKDPSRMVSRLFCFKVRF